MSQSTTTPTDRSHYSWTPASTQSSQSIIQSSDNAAGRDQTSTAQEQSSTIPVIPRRSSYNYAHDSAQFSGIGGSSSAGGLAGTPASQVKELKDSEVEGLQRKLFHERKKSYTAEDQKRAQHEFMLRDDKNPQSFSEV